MYNLLLVPDQDQHPTQDINYNKIAWITATSLVVLGLIILVVFCVIKKGCYFALSCFSNELHESSVSEFMRQVFQTSAFHSTGRIANSNSRKTAQLGFCVKPTHTHTHTQTRPSVVTTLLCYISMNLIHINCNCGIAS